MASPPNKKLSLDLNLNSQFEEEDFGYNIPHVPSLANNPYIDSWETDFNEEKQLDFDLNELPSSDDVDLEHNEVLNASFSREIFLESNEPLTDSPLNEVLLKYFVETCQTFLSFR